jgi:hypothetical protein
VDDDPLKVAQPLKNPKMIKSFSPVLADEIGLGWVIAQNGNLPGTGWINLVRTAMQPILGRIIYGTLTQRSRSSPARLGSSTLG